MSLYQLTKCNRGRVKCLRHLIWRNDRMLHRNAHNCKLKLLRRNICHRIETQSSIQFQFAQQPHQHRTGLIEQLTRRRIFFNFRPSPLIVEVYNFDQSTQLPFLIKLIENRGMHCSNDTTQIQQQCFVNYPIVSNQMTGRLLCCLRSKNSLPAAAVD